MEKEIQVEIVGQKIVGIRKMTQAEYEAEGWEDLQQGLNKVIILENGLKLYASQDGEGNGPGTMFGSSAKGETFYM